MSQRKAKRARQQSRAAAPPPQPRRLPGRRLAVLVALIAVAAAIGAGFALSAGTGGATHRAAGGGSLKLQGTDPITGRHVSLDQFAGKPVLLNVWASWCTGCNQEARDLARFAAQHSNVGVLGVDTQDTTGGAKAFYRKYSWHHPSIADPSGSMAAGLGVVGLPTTFFLNAQHKVVARIVGAGNLAAFNAGLRRATLGA